jgi:hypothetical protein
LEEDSYLIGENTTGRRNGSSPLAHRNLVMPTIPLSLLSSLMSLEYSHAIFYII